MKRALIVSVAALLIALPALAAADKPIAPDVQVTLEKALRAEREAVARCTAFAKKADEEGYPGAASLFRAMADAEQIHAKRFAAALKDHGISVPPESDSYKPLVGSTSTNLRTAATNEIAERDGMYRDAIETCRRHGDSETAKLFDETRDVEVEHGNLCIAAGRDLDALKQPKTYFVCERCGYTTDVDLSLCPDCRHREHLQPVK